MIKMSMNGKVKITRLYTLISAALFSDVAGDSVVGLCSQPESCRSRSSDLASPPFATTSEFSIMQILRSKIYLLYRNEHLEVIIQKMKDLERVDEFMDDAKRAY